MDKLAYTYKTHSNRLRHVYDEVSPSAYPNDIDDQKLDNYIYNDIGQLIFNKQDNLGYTYYTNGLMKAIYNGKIGEAGTTKRVAFQYNESGHRIKKLSYNPEGTLLKTTFYVRDAAGTAIAIYFKDEGNTDKSIILAENGVYGSSRLGTLNRTTETMLYEIKDHLGNVRAVVGKDQEGNMASIVKGRAEYYPFGSQFPDKRDLDYRYAYQGQEKDEETGMEAFELRLWDSRLGRWLTPDPYAQYPSPYLGMGNNPANMIDPDGGLAKGGPGDGWKKFWGGLKSLWRVTFGGQKAKMKNPESINGEALPEDGGILLEEVVLDGKKKIGVQRMSSFMGIPVRNQSFADPNEASIQNEINRLNSYEIAKVGYENVGIGLQGYGSYTPKPKQYNFRGITSSNASPNITYSTSQGNYPSWTTVKKRYWNITNGGETPTRLAWVKTKRGDFVKIKVSKELHHIHGRGGNDPHRFENLQEVWPWEHAAVDKYRHTGYEFIKWAD